MPALRAVRNGRDHCLLYTSRQKEDVEKIKDVAVQKYGTITTLANCAGVLVHKHFLDHNLSLIHI